MNPTKSSKTPVSKIVEKAEKSLKAAQYLFDEGHFDFAASRAYYAAFYSMVAVLATKDMSFKKHSGVIGAFNKHFIKTGIFQKILSRQVNRLFQERAEADYDYDAVIEKNDAEQDLQAAEEILSAIIEYLAKEGFLDLPAG